jgi:hypothetical protein
MAATPLIQTSSSWFENVTFDVISPSYQVINMLNVPSNTVIFTGLIGHLQNAQFSKEAQADKERARSSPWILTVTTQSMLQLGQLILITSVRNPYGMWEAQPQPQMQYVINFLNESYSNSFEKILRLARKDQVASNVNTATGVIQQ